MVPTVRSNALLVPTVRSNALLVPTVMSNALFVPIIYVVPVASPADVGLAFLLLYVLPLWLASFLPKLFVLFFLCCFSAPVALFIIALQKLF